ncbi:MAG: hypothetical protein JWO82_880 [Akkermansiaceae bacterium]|nr:hypothetical protein [Akkermansiaceae bacterium]
MVRKKRRRRGGSEVDEKTSRKRRRDSRRKARIVAVVAIVWVVLTAGTAVLMRWKFPEKPEETLATQQIEQMSDEDRNILLDDGEEMGKEISSFLRDTNPSSRASHVLRSPVAMTKMLRLTTMTSELAYNGKLSLVSKYVVDTPAGKGFAALWDFETKQQVEAVFFKEDGHWKIDWDEYARYSPDSWQLFLAGGGESHGEFRLFARQRADTGYLPPNQMGITLSLPKFGQPAETTSSSPQIVVDRDSDVGQQLQAAFAARAKNEDVFGSRLVEHDPDGQVRVRVKVSRQEGETRTFKIDELLACHWFGFDEKAAGAAPVPKP